MRAHIILLALVCVLIGQLTAPAQAALPKTEREFHAALKKANPDYTGKGKVYRNDKDGIWGADISTCKVSTLEPLRGMLIRVLACSDNTIKDLTPLKGMKLLELVCDNNPITDLSPISGMPIWKLGIKGTKVTDLTPLEDMKLRDFVFSPGNITKGIDIVRDMKTIQFYPTPEQRNLSSRGDGAHLMTRMSAEKFWKLYDQRHRKKSQASSSAGFRIEEIRLGEMHDKILATAFSKDGCHLAYMTTAGDKYLVVVDGRTGGHHEGIAEDALVFSPDGEHSGYVAGKGSKQFVVVDEQEGPEYDMISEDGPVFSRDSKRVAYGAKKSGRWFVVVDGQAGPAFDGIGVPGAVFSPDGRRVAYPAGKDGKWFVVVDGQSGLPWDGIDSQGPVFSPDSGHVAYAAKKGEKWFVIVDGQIGPEYDGTGNDSIVFSPDGKRVAHAARKGNKWFVVVDGQPGPGFDGLGSILFSSAGDNRVAYFARKGSNWRAYVNDKSGPAWDRVDALTFSPDGRRWAHAAKSGEKWLVVVDGQPGPEYDGVAAPLTFSSDSKHVAYGAMKDDKWFAVVDGQPGSDVEGRPIFSSDCKHVAYVTERGGKSVVVVDRQAGPEYDAIIKNGPTFHPNNVLEYLAVKERLLFRVKHVPVSQAVSPTAQSETTFALEAIAADEAERMRRLGKSWSFRVSVFNKKTGQIAVIEKETMDKLNAFAGSLDFGKESDRRRCVAEVVRLLGEERARWGITISDANGRPAFRWPSTQGESQRLVATQVQPARPSPTGSPPGAAPFWRITSAQNRDLLFHDYDYVRTKDGLAFVPKIKKGGRLVLTFGETPGTSPLRILIEMTGEYPDLGKSDLTKDFSFFTQDGSQIHPYLTAQPKKIPAEIVGDPSQKLTICFVLCKTQRWLVGQDSMGFFKFDTRISGGYDLKKVFISHKGGQKTAISSLLDSASPTKQDSK